MLGPGPTSWASLDLGWVAYTSINTSGVPPGNSWWWWSGWSCGDGGRVYHGGGGDGFNDGDGVGHCGGWVGVGNGVGGGVGECGVFSVTCKLSLRY